MDLETYMKPILIVGQPRTASSSITKMVQDLGVFVGDDFEPLKANSDGTYEDFEFTSVSHAYIQEDISRDEFLHRLEELVWVRNKDHELWGVKDPRAYKMLKDYIKIIKPRFIRTHRPAHTCIDSMVKTFKWTRERAYKTYNAINYILDERLQGQEVLNIYMEDLKNQTAINKLRNFIYG